MKLNSKDTNANFEVVGLPSHQQIRSEIRLEVYTSDHQIESPQPPRLLDIHTKFKSFSSSTHNSLEQYALKRPIPQAQVYLALDSHIARRRERMLPSPDKLITRNRYSL